MSTDYHNMQPLANRNWTNQANATSLLQAKLSGRQLQAMPAPVCKRTRKMRIRYHK